MSGLNRAYGVRVIARRALARRGNLLKDCFASLAMTQCIDKQTGLCYYKNHYEHCKYA